jgi:hypothetical protein
MKFKANVEDGIVISDIVLAATNPRDWSELGRRLSVYFKAHFSDDHSDDHKEWLRFLSNLRVIPAKKDRREVQKHTGRWCRVTSKEWHMVVDLRNEGRHGDDCILFVPQETVEKLIVLEEI